MCFSGRKRTDGPKVKVKVKVKHFMVAAVETCNPREVGGWLSYVIEILVSINKY